MHTLSRFGFWAISKGYAVQVSRPRFLPSSIGGVEVVGVAIPSVKAVVFAVLIAAVVVAGCLA